MKYVKQNRLILASKSPRRKKLLEQAGIEFSIIVSTVDESRVKSDQPSIYSTQLALLKAKDVASQNPDYWILGADTIVTINNQILGKPKSNNDAAHMLSMLNSTTHQVYTGYCLYHERLGINTYQSVSTEVKFKSLSDREINWYIQTGEPFDKAGGYGIQGVGAFMIEQITGSYTNVVGLPVCEVIQSMVELDIIEF